MFCGPMTRSPSFSEPGSGVSLPHIKGWSGLELDIPLPPGGLGPGEIAPLEGRLC